MLVWKSCEACFCFFRLILLRQTLHQSYLFGPFIGDFLSGDLTDRFAIQGHKISRGEWQVAHACFSQTLAYKKWKILSIFKIHSNCGTFSLHKFQNRCLWEKGWTMRPAAQTIFKISDFRSTYSGMCRLESNVNKRYSLISWFVHFCWHFRISTSWVFYRYKLPEV